MILEGLGLLSIAMIGFGAYLINPAYGFISSGGILFLTCAAAAWKQSKKIEKK